MEREIEDKIYITVSIFSSSFEEKQKMNRQIDWVAEKYNGKWIGQGTFIREEDNDLEDHQFIHDIGYDIPAGNVEIFISEVRSLNPQFDVSRG
jgi:hypothetical protein